LAVFAVFDVLYVCLKNSLVAVVLRVRRNSANSILGSKPVVDDDLIISPNLAQRDFLAASLARRTHCSRSRQHSA